MLPQPRNKRVSLKFKLQPAYVPAGGLTYRSLSDFSGPKMQQKHPTLSDWSCGHIWNIQPQIAFKLIATDTKWPKWKHLSDWVTQATEKSDHFSGQQTFSVSFFFFFNLLILWTVCRDWWLTQLYPAPTASQVTRHLGLAETAAHWVSWKCFNRNVETVEKCIILHIATKIALS